MAKIGESSEDSVTFEIDESDGHTSVVKVWCDGRVREPDTEAYRPEYSYSITTPTWEYVDNDIHGAVNETPDLYKAAQSLFAFLYACQEGMPKPNGENSDLFPPQVRDWAYQHSEHISQLSMHSELKGGE